MGKENAGPDAGAPRQEAAERRAIRAKYRTLRDSALANREVLANATNTYLEQRLDELQQLHSKVEKPREHAVDAEVFVEFTTCAIDMARQGQAAAKGRSPADLVATLGGLHNHSAHLGLDHLEEAPEAFDWFALGARVATLFAPCPGLSCMFGPLAAPAKLRAKAVRSAKRPLAALVSPDQLAIEAETEKQETDRHVMAMHKALQEAGCPVPLAELVCNHQSFSQTVENLFTLSFLVKDQRVSLTRCQEMGIQVISTTLQQQPPPQGRTGGGGGGGASSSRAPGAAAAAADGAGAAAGPSKPRQQAVKTPPVQFMVNFTMGDWDTMRALVAPASCLMPHRAPHDAAADVAGPHLVKKVRRSSAA